MVRLRFKIDESLIDPHTRFEIKVNGKVANIQDVGIELFEFLAKREHQHTHLIQIAKIELNRRIDLGEMSELEALLIFGDI